MKFVYTVLQKNKADTTPKEITYYVSGEDEAATNATLRWFLDNLDRISEWEIVESEPLNKPWYKEKEGETWICIQDPEGKDAFDKVYPPWNGIGFPLEVLEERKMQNNGLSKEDSDLLKKLKKMDAELTKMEEEIRQLEKEGSPQALEKTRKEYYRILLNFPEFSLFKKK